MSMSKKDYEAVATLLGNIGGEVAHKPTLTPSEAVALVTLGLANIFHADNPRFDRDRFLRAVTDRTADNA